MRRSYFFVKKAARIVIVTGAASVFGCASLAHESSFDKSHSIAWIKAKPELIRPYRKTDQNREPYEAPYLAKYSRNGKSLWFAAVDHTDEIESPTFRMLKHSVEVLKPEAVIVEGVEYTGVFSPPSHQNYVRKMASEKFRGSSESIYAAWLAMEHQVPFIPGEPTDKTIATSLEEKGYTKLDYFYFFLARAVPQWRRTKRVNSLNHFESRAAAEWASFSGPLSLSGPFQFVKFQSWFLQKMGRVFDFYTIGSEDFSPQIDRDPSYLNLMAHEVGMIREKHVLTLIEMLLKRYDRVLIEYGSGHLVKERDALQDLLGEGKNEKPD